MGPGCPTRFWQHLFFTGHPLLAKIWGPLLGPVISIFAFVCSIGNVPLAAVLWNGGISFGGVISFIFADLIILPILVIYRKYYGTKMMLFILATFYVTMVMAGYAVELIFGAAGLIPPTRNANGAQSDDQLELHDLPQHRLHHGWRRAGMAVLPYRRGHDAQDDGRQSRTR